MKKSLLIFFASVLIYSPASGSPRGHIVDVIDTPTASPVDFGSYSLSFRLYNGGSILTRLFYGIIMKDLTLGISFDAGNVVGTGDIMPRRPYLYVKLPLYSGSGRLPAVSVGYDEQGFGSYDTDEEEYFFAPTGFFLVMTSMGLAPGLNAGAGINADYSASGDDEKIRGFVNADYTIGPEFMLTAEVRSIGENGYVNTGFKYMMRPELHFEFAMLNLGGRGEPERMLRATYRGEF